MPKSYPGSFSSPFLLSNTDFLLASLLNKNSGYMDIRGEHYGIAVPSAGGRRRPSPLITWIARIGVPLTAILIPVEFFLSIPFPVTTQPNGMIGLIYAGAVVLGISVVTLEVGLLRAAAPAG